MSPVFLYHLHTTPISIPNLPWDVGTIEQTQALAKEYCFFFFFLFAMLLLGGKMKWLFESTI